MAVSDRTRTSSEGWRPLSEHDHGDACLTCAWSRVEAALERLDSYDGWSVAADGPGYVARSGDLEAWSDDDGPTPTAALTALAEKLEARDL